MPRGKIKGNVVGRYFISFAGRPVSENLPQTRQHPLMNKLLTDSHSFFHIACSFVKFILPLVQLVHDTQCVGNMRNAVQVFIRM